MSVSAVFPEEFVDPRDKEKKEYGAQYARAMWAVYEWQGGVVYGYNHAEMRFLEAIAQGSQSVQTVKNLLGFGSGLNQNQSLAPVDIQVMNYATKIINEIVGKITEQDYDIVATPVDPLSQDMLSNYEAELRAYKELKPLMEQMGVDEASFFANAAAALSEVAPEDMEERIVELMENRKLRLASEAENAIKVIYNERSTNWKQQRRILAYDAVIWGLLGTWADVDKNGRPFQKRVDMKNAVLPFSKEEHYPDMDYGGYWEYITLAQFRREAGPFLTQAEIDEYAEKHGSQIGNPSSPPFLTASITATNDGLKYIPVLRFQFLTENSENYIIKRNRFGNKELLQRPYNYHRVQTFDKDVEDKINNTYTARYQGTWIIGSDCCYDYGPKADNRIGRQDASWVDTKLTMCVHAPNMRNGRIVSIAAQLKEPLTMFNVVYNRIKQIIARGYSGALEINLAKLAEMPVAKGGESMGPLEVVDMFLKSGILTTNIPLNQFGQDVKAAIMEIPFGLTFADYLSEMNQISYQIREISGLDAPINPQSLVGVEEKKAHQVYNALDYLFQSLGTQQEASVKVLLELIQLSARDHTLVGMIPAVGSESVKYWESSELLPLLRYGLMLERKPTANEWNEFYADLREAAKSGQITPADQAYVRQVDNLKQARQLLVRRADKNLKEAQKAKQADVENNAQVQQQSIEQNKQAQLEVLQLQAQIDLAKLSFQRETELMLLQKKEQLGVFSVERTAQAKEVSTRQQGQDMLVKEALRSQTELEKADKQLVAAKAKAAKTPAK